MAKKKRKEKDPEELSTENELMKLKMMAEFGGKFVDNENIPPELENLFLKQILKFHRKSDRTKLTTVFQLIGEPEYDHVNDLSEKEITKELARLLKMMRKKGIDLDFYPETGEREIYRFVVEELFKEEVPEGRVKGWINEFTYEDYYPNPEADAKYITELCLEYVFEKDAFLLPDLLSDDMKDHLGLTVDTEDVIDTIEEFKQQFNQLKLADLNMKVTELGADGQTARVVADVEYKTQFEKGKKFKTETARLEIGLTKGGDEADWWVVNQIISDLF